jgi:ribosomal protein L30/L7E
MKKLLIKQVGSTARCDDRQVLYMKSLGLRRIGNVVERVDNETNRKLISKLHHLVKVVGEKQVVAGKEGK